MTYAKWTFRIVALLLVGAFLHYNLPQHDVVRILNTEIKRMAVEVENAQGETVSRTEDVRYINTAHPDGSVYVYRNQDTGWGWPPYFKFDSANLAAQADNATSTEKEPEWYVLTHYGWRITYLSMFPNAISLERAEGPDQSIIPWFNIVVIALLIGAVLWLRARIRRFAGRVAEA